MGVGPKAISAGWASHAVADFVRNTIKLYESLKYSHSSLVYLASYRRLEEPIRTLQAPGRISLKRSSALCPTQGAAWTFQSNFESGVPNTERVFIARVYSTRKAVARLLCPLPYPYL